MQTALHNLDPAALAELARIGPIWGRDIPGHGDIVRNIYTPLIRSAAADGIAVSSDIAYGAHPRQVLDVHVKPGVSHAPVVAFVHGGAFVRGDKCTNEAIYGNVLNWFAARGYVGINLEYRLAPEATHPEAARDVASAMAWLAAHVANYGGDPAQIHLIGHSAGATHVASYACDPLVGNYAREAASVSLISGRLAADISPENPNAPGVRAYFGDDPGFFAERAPMAYAHLTSKPLMLVYAEFENPLLDIYTLEFAHRVAFAKRRAPRVLRMNRHNHVSVMAHFNSGEEILGHAMIDFFETRS